MKKEKIISKSKTYNIFGITFEYYINAYKGIFINIETKRRRYLLDLRKILLNQPIKYCRIVKDKNNWWLIDGEINISISFNQFTEEQIIYLTHLYKKLGYQVTIDRSFGETY